MSNLPVVVVAVGETFDAHLTLAATPPLVWKLQAIVAPVPFGAVISVKEFTLLVFTLVILNALIVLVNVKLNTVAVLKSILTVVVDDTAENVSLTAAVSILPVTIVVPVNVLLPAIL